MKCLSIIKRVSKLLRETADKLDAGNSELSESEAMAIARMLCQEGLSKAQACRYLNMSRSKFDTHIRLKQLPKGKKITGFSELRWYKDELDEYANKLKK